MIIYASDNEFNNLTQHTTEPIVATPLHEVNQTTTDIVEQAESNVEIIPSTDCIQSNLEITPSTDHIQLNIHITPKHEAEELLIVHSKAHEESTHVNELLATTPNNIPVVINTPAIPLVQSPIEVVKPIINQFPYISNTITIAPKLYYRMVIGDKPTTVDDESTKDVNNDTPWSLHAQIDGTIHLNDKYRITATLLRPALFQFKWNQIISWCGTLYTPIMDITVGDPIIYTMKLLLEKENILEKENMYDGMVYCRHVFNTQFINAAKYIWMPGLACMPYIKIHDINDILHNVIVKGMVSIRFNGETPTGGMLITSDEMDAFFGYIISELFVANIYAHHANLKGNLCIYYQKHLMLRTIINIASIVNIFKFTGLKGEVLKLVYIKIEWQNQKLIFIGLSISIPIKKLRLTILIDLGNEFAIEIFFVPFVRTDIQSLKNNLQLTIADNV